MKEGQPIKNIVRTVGALGAATAIYFSPDIADAQGGIIQPTAGPTSTPQTLPTGTPVGARTAVPTCCVAPQGEIKTPTEGPTSTPQTLPTGTPVGARTAVPTCCVATPTEVATNTPVPPTATRTSTAVPTSTETPIPPTATATATESPTPQTLPTGTPVPPTATNTSTPVPGNTPMPPHGGLEVNLENCAGQSEQENIELKLGANDITASGKDINTGQVLGVGNWEHLIVNGQDKGPFTIEEGKTTVVTLLEGVCTTATPAESIVINTATPTPSVRLTATPVQKKATPESVAPIATPNINVTPAATGPELPDSLKSTDKNNLLKTIGVSALALFTTIGTAGTVLKKRLAAKENSEIIKAALEQRNNLKG